MGNAKKSSNAERKVTPLTNAASTVDVKERELIMDMVAKYEAWKEDLMVTAHVQMLRKQLQAKFPKASKRALAKLEKAKLEQLERWALRVLTADTLEEVFA